MLVSGPNNRLLRGTTRPGWTLEVSGAQIEPSSASNSLLLSAGTAGSGPAFLCPSARSPWPKSYLWLRGALLGLDVAAEVHQRFDRLGDECRGLLGVCEGIGAGLHRLRVARAHREHLGLDDARVPVVDGSQDGDRAPVLLRVADEKLACVRRRGLRQFHAAGAALTAACSTVFAST